jgi:hypothetical protein
VQHIEVHTISNETEALEAEQLGIIAFRVFETCENCEQEVAYTANGFYPCAIILYVDEDDEDVEYLLCDACITPVTNPGLTA